MANFVNDNNEPKGDLMSSNIFEYKYDRKTLKLTAIGAVLLILFLTASSAYAVPCTPGTYCVDLPPEVGSQKFRKDLNGGIHDITWKPNWIEFDDNQDALDNGDIIGIGWTNPGYQPDKPDPSWGDDSFFTYLHIERYLAYYEFDRIFQALNNSCSSKSQPYEFTLKHTTSYTHFEESTVHSEFSSKLGDTIAGIGSKVGASQTFGQSWTASEEIGQKYTVVLDCCSGEAWWNQYKIIELELDIGYQIDKFGSW